MVWSANGNCEMNQKALVSTYQAIVPSRNIYATLLYNNEYGVLVIVFDFRTEGNASRRL